MLIKTLEEAENLVSQNNDLRWNGWDIIAHKKTDAGYTSKNGVFYNNSWGIDKSYPITTNGWHIPNKYAGGTNG